MPPLTHSVGAVCGVAPLGSMSRSAPPTAAPTRPLDAGVPRSHGPSAPASFGPRVNAALDYKRRQVKIELLVIVISRDEVEKGDVAHALATLKRLLESPEIARSYQERVNIAFLGYDSDSRELYEIPEVRSFAYNLDDEFPYWLYFLSKNQTDLHALLLCFLPPFLTDEGKAKYFPERIDRLLTKRWFPALNHIGTFVGMSMRENETITERTMQYILKGPLRIKGIAPETP